MHCKHFSGSDVVNALAKDLKSHYTEKLCKKQISPWRRSEFLDLDQVYVPMTIDTTIPGESPIKKRLNSYQNLLKSGRESSRFVLLGGPGQGKSVFCALIAHDWCNNENLSALKNIQLLFVLQLAAMNLETSNIEDAIRSQLSIQTDSESLGKIMHDLGDSVAIVLDGLDEMEPVPSLEKDKKVGTLVKTIKGNHLKDCRLFITSRPGAENRIVQLQGQGYQRLLLQKVLSKSDVKEMVQKYFSLNEDDEALSIGLLDLIEQNKMLIPTSTPMMVMMICWYWAQTKGEHGYMPERINEFYSQVVDMMLNKQPDKPSDDDKVGACTQILYSILKYGLNFFYN